MYESIREWRDLEDGHLYHTGEPFPHDGREISESRIAELSGTQNKAGFALIKALPKPDEEKPVREAEQAQKPVKNRRKMA
jgi:hypothetical protein